MKTSTHHRIGILDSGIGGLTIRETVCRELPGISTDFVADSAYMPYGEKDAETVVSRVKGSIGFLLGRGAEMIVVACNTATVLGIDAYRESFPGIPIVGVVPVVKTAAQLTGNGSFAVFSTKRTNESRYLTDLITTFAPACRVSRIGSSTLASLIETEEDLMSPAIRLEVERMVAEVPDDADVIALGCTHYPLVAGVISRAAGPGKKIIDSGGAVARQVGRILEKMKPSENDGVRHFVWTTGDSDRLARRLDGISGIPSVVQHVDIP